MSDQMELEGVIEDAVNDAASPDTASPDVEVSDTPADDTPAEESQVTSPGGEPESSQAPAPGATSSESVEDEFAKRFNLQGTSITGRENRIPYSRVKKIVERAEKEALAKAKTDIEGGFTPKVTELEAKVTDYEGRLTKVAEFEQLIEHRPKEFLDFLGTLPAYKDFFAYIQQLATGQPAGAAKPEKPYLDTASMPQPDQRLADGSMVYSLEGLAKRDEWLARQVEQRAITQAEARMAQRYQPMEEQYQAEQRRQAAIPVIQKQIADARSWPHFTENEAAIIAVLQGDPKISLEGAYRQVVTSTVFPKLQADRDTMRASILEELKKKPVATSAPTSAVKPDKMKAGKRSLEEIIQEAANSLKN